jgi:pyruvate,water dikinase
MHPSEPGPGADASLGDAIAAILGRQDLAAAESSRLIRALWEDLVLSPDLVEELHRALARLFAPPASSTPGQAAAFVAVRSSTQEEDTERAARAGEFDTYLFVPPDARALDALKRAWAGFWSERAIHNRRVLGLTGTRVGGGVLVQRMIQPRASGVIQTVNVGSHDPGEMLVTVGLGVGEGVVSGTVGADLITVAKDSLGNGRSPRFRYVPGDKRTQMVFDRARGTGTVLVPSSYHQRFRPALEYMELRELIETAARLESAYGLPLDIEFAVEEGRLWVLQARPVAQAQAVLEETRERFPLSPPPSPPGNTPSPPGKEQDS